jgi:DNA-binding CsgD family transcriptional regulator
MCHAAGHIAYEKKFIDDRSIPMHEFYDGILRTAGVQYFLGSRIFDQGDVSLFHSIEFTRQHGHPDAEKIASFKRLAPVIGNAWRLAARTTSIAENQDLSRWTPDHLPWAIFALASNGTIMEMNSAASSLLGEKDILIQSDGALVAAHRNSIAGFLCALEQAMAGQTAETLLLSGTGAALFAAQFVPVSSPHDSTVVSPSVLVYIWNPLHRTKKLGDILARLYGFTTAEARLAAKLATGMELNTAAEHLGITRNTARNQLQNLFAKTGTRRQSEFLARIIGVLEC